MSRRAHKSLQGTPCVKELPQDQVPQSEQAGPAAAVTRPVESELTQAAAAACAPVLTWETHVGVNEITFTFARELTIADASALHEKLLQALAGGLDVRLELQCVPYLDAAILQLICAARRTATATGVQLTLQHPQQPAIENARMFGMASVLVDDAIAAEG